MSYHSTQSQAYHPSHHPSAAAGKANYRPQHRRANAQHHASSRSGYTIAHAGRQVRFGPVVFWIVVGTIVLMGGWSAATATYFAFKDDVLTRVMASKAQMQYSYEDRIAELRARIDRTTSRQMLNQEEFERKLDDILRRQSILERRSEAIDALPDVTVTGSVRTSSRDRGQRVGDKGTQSAGNIIERLQTSLDRVEQRQIAALSAAEDMYENRMRRMRGVVSDLGLSPSRLGISAPRGVGGPYVPVRLSNKADAFERKIHRVNISRAQADKMNLQLARIPYRRPITATASYSSPFGVRSDPFLGRPAMHTGLDFRAPTGMAVLAAASGRVVKAGWHGGYGRMIEVDHGGGLTTRYGHLSAIGVKIGATVRPGQNIGAVGSTGRSTGPHLHYETRIDGKATDPQRFLRAGSRLAAG